MGEKSAQKRKFIIDTARGVFADKGYKAVTMKDVVEACQISRGGLYLYFSNTEDLFLAVLEDENEDDDEPALPFYAQNQQSYLDGKSITQRLYAAEIKPPPKIPIYILYGVFRT